MHWLMAAGVAAGTGWLLTRLFTVDDSPAGFEGRFKLALERAIAEARRAGESHVEINAGDLHRAVGGYPGPEHHIALCCRVMREAMGPADFAVREPRSRSGPSLTLRYHLGDAAEGQTSA